LSPSHFYALEVEGRLSHWALGGGRNHWWPSVLTLELSRIKCPRRSPLNRHLKLVVLGIPLILLYKARRKFRWAV